MKTIDARKQNCPKPIIMTKDALDAGEKEITTIVDNETAKNNVMKFMKKQGFEPAVEEINGDYYVSAIIDCTETVTIRKEEVKENRGYFIGTNKLGAGSDDLGELLMKGFVYTLTQSKPYPKFILLVNSGVKLACEGSDSIEDLKTLAKNGVEIIACGTCLDFFNLKSNLMIGEVGNMYDIVDTMNAADKVTTLG